MNDNISQLQHQAEGAKRLYSTGDYSDLTITCQGKEWKVHKFQLCVQSDFFRNACSGEFKEAQENKISLDDDDPQVVEAMLSYLYTGVYGDAGNGPSAIPSILLDVYIFTIADKYFIKLLKDKAAENFSTHCESEWFTSGFAQAVEEVYSTTPQNKTLGDIAVNVVKEHFEDLFNPHSGFDDFHRVLRSVPSFSADILAKFDSADRATSGKK